MIFNDPDDKSRQAFEKSGLGHSLTFLDYPSLPAAYMMSADYDMQRQQGQTVSIISVLCVETIQSETLLDHRVAAVTLIPVLCDSQKKWPA